MFGLGVEVSVRDVRPSRRILFDWGGGGSVRTVDIEFAPWGADGTYVQVTETGFVGTGDEFTAWLADSTSGFTQMLCALKTLLEHDVVLTVVRDHLPTTHR